MVFVDSAEIMRLMIRKKLGTYELARRADVKSVTVQRVLEGRFPTKIMTIFKIASALGVDHNELITGYTTEK